MDSFAILFQHHTTDISLALGIYHLLFTENQVVAMEREAFYEMSSAEFIKVCR